MDIVISFVSLLSGLSIFMVGIKQMSSGLEKISTSRMQKGLSKVSNNRFVSFGFGTFITAIMQSSTLVTVMTISFLNANLLTLFQGIAIILGANIGTTLTAVISSFATVDYAIFLSLFVLVGILIDMFTKQESIKRISSIFIGFGLIFIGLNLASEAFKTNEMKEFISNIFTNINFPILLIFISMILTAIVHSSTLIVGLSIILVSTQTIPLEYALFIVLGAEIGTTTTGVIASLSLNANAKRLAFVQFIFNVFGTILFTTILLIFKEPILNVLTSLSLNFQVAFFQVFFNVSTALLALIFIKQLEKLANIVIKDNKSQRIKSRNLIYINENLLSTPAFAITALNKEIERMFDLTKNNLSNALKVLIDNEIHLIDSVIQNESLIDDINQGIALYLAQLSNQPMTYSLELSIGKMYHLINDLERIADHAHNFAIIKQDLLNDGTDFSKAAKDDISVMGKKILNMFDLAFDIYENKRTDLLKDLSKLENEIDEQKLVYETNHVTRLRMGECQLEHSKYFFDFTSQLERIGDHLVNIGYTIINMVGNEPDAN